MTLILSGTDGLSDVDGTAATPAIRGTDANTGIFFPAADTIGFAEGGAEVMRIDSSGNVGVGATPPTSDLGKSITINTAGNSLWSSQANQTDLLANATYNGGWKFVSGSSNYANRISVGNANGQYAWQTSSAAGTSGNAITFNQLMTLNTNGVLSLYGGSTTATGVGITFPATQSASSDANTLDDYEEGTFTPTAFGSTTAGTTTYQVQQGSYIKIGRQVTISVRVGWTALTGTGELTFGGFPFASANDSMEYMGAVMTADLNWGGGTYLQFYKGSNTTTGVLFYLSDDAGFNSQQCVNESSSIRFTVTYFTA